MAASLPSRTARTSRDTGRFLSSVGPVSSLSCGKGWFQLSVNSPSWRICLLRFLRIFVAFNLSCGLQFPVHDPVIALRFQFQGQFLAAGFDDAAIEQHV